MRNDGSTAASLARWTACVVAAAFSAWAAAPLKAQATYTGAVLYPLTIPSGFESSLPVVIGSPGSSIAGQTVGAAYAPAGQNALIWSANSVINLNPTGYQTSIVAATDGTQQFGNALVEPNQEHVLLWSGSAQAFVDLTPSGATSAGAEGMSSTQQVGFVGNSAYVWSGTAASAVDLAPAGYTGSEARGTNGSQQVGWALDSAGMHAMLWSGSAATAVKLDPPGSTSSQAVGISPSGNQQVGNGILSGATSEHALMWSGTSASTVDLNPAGASSSYAVGTNGADQIGYIISGSNDEAYLWSGSAASAVNLQSLLPETDAWTSSMPSSIDASGNVFGTAVGTVNGVTGTYAVEWAAPVPEPAMLPCLAIIGAVLLSRRRRSVPRRCAE
ncbi:MAG: hypothetical protein ABSH22_01520 [Tepidisphaeraceae bacterium]|jgi:hypothetical protein